MRSKTSLSKQENELLCVLKSMYDFEYLQSFRPDWLKNKSTGQNLEIDIYIPKYMVGFEFQGAVHFNNISRYKNDSDKSRLHDLKKYDMLNGVAGELVIVEIFDCDLNGDVKKNILTRVLNTQEYWFKHKHFTKCKQLERVYVRLSGHRHTSPATNSVKWFSYCIQLAFKESYKLTEEQAIKKLYDFNKNREILHAHRYTLQYKSVCELMGCNYEFYLSRIEKIKEYKEIRRQRVNMERINRENSNKAPL